MEKEGSVKGEEKGGERPKGKGKGRERETRPPVEISGYATVRNRVSGSADGC